MRTIGVLVSALLLAGGASPLWAHHSAAMFDKTKPTTVEATVREFQWTNPHSWLNIMAPVAGSSPILLSLEGPAPSGMTRQGLKSTDFRPGEKLTVTYFPMRDGRPGGLLNKVVADGKTMVDFHNGG